MTPFKNILYQHFNQPIIMSEIVNEITEVVETNEEVNTEVETEEEFSDLTEDDYNKLSERLKKAESTIVKYKKAAKKTPETSNGDNITKADLDLIRFVDKNPGYEGKEEELKSYMEKGLSVNEAKKLVSPDEVTENRAKTKSSSITAGEQGGTKTQYTVDELEKMSQSEYNRVTDLVDAGKAVIK